MVDDRIENVGIARRTFLKQAAVLGGLGLLSRLHAAAPTPEVPAWWHPPEWPTVNGRGHDGPFQIPENGDSITEHHFVNWTADGIWPQSGRAGVAFAYDEDPSVSWTMERCRFSDCRGEVICGRYGMDLRDLWFDHGSNLGVVGFGATSLRARNLNFWNVCQDHPELLWDHCGAIKVCSGPRELPVEPFVDINGLRVHRCWNGPYLWIDTGPVVRKLWNASLTGGCRTRGLMFECCAGDPAHSPSLKNVEIAHSNHEPRHGWGNVFNGVVLIMNSRDLSGENLTVITPPHCSAFAFQDDDARHDHGYTAPNATRDLDFHDGLIVLRGDDSTLERHWWHQAGKNRVGENIRLRDFEVWVETGRASAARERSESPFAESLEIRAMTPDQIDSGLRDRGQAHLLPISKNEIRRAGDSCHADQKNMRTGVSALPEGAHS